MAKEKENTVTLPALSNGRVYISIAETLPIKFGLEIGMVDFSPADYSDATNDGLMSYGARQCGMDGGAKSKETPDAVKRQGALDRIAAIKAGTHVFGKHGGGSRLSTYKVVLRENVLAALVKIGFKKGDVTKDVTADAESAYHMVSAATAKEIGGKATMEAVQGIMWPKMERDAQAEATRRDKATGQFTMDDSTREAILAAATAPQQAAA